MRLPVRAARLHGASKRSTRSRRPVSRMGTETATSPWEAARLSCACAICSAISTCWCQSSTTRSTTWCAEDEVEKLLRHGEGWLQRIRTLPDRRPLLEASARSLRVLRWRAWWSTMKQAEETAEAHACEEAAVEAPIRLGEQRHAAVLTALEERGATRSTILGAAKASLSLRLLLAQPRFTRIVGLDVSTRHSSVPASGCTWTRRRRAIGSGSP